MREKREREIEKESTAKQNKKQLTCNQLNPAFSDGAEVKSLRLWLLYRASGAEVALTPAQHACILLRSLILLNVLSVKTEPITFRQSRFPAAQHALIPFWSLIFLQNAVILLK